MFLRGVLVLVLVGVVFSVRCCDLWCWCRFWGWGYGMGWDGCLFFGRGSKRRFGRGDLGVYMGDQVSGSFFTFTFIFCILFYRFFFYLSTPSRDLVAWDYGPGTKVGDDR